MTFTGFSRQAIDFYARLEDDNSRSFWAANKDVYESEVRDPMRALLADLEPEFGAGKIFRPYRDARFGHADVPYKTAQAAFVGPSPGVGWYLQIDADGLLVGGGFRSHGASQVQRYREAVADDATGEQLRILVTALREAGFDIEGDELKTRPRGIDVDHPRLDLLRCRSLMVTKHYGDPAWLATPEALDVVRDTWRTMRPLNDWVMANVGSAFER